MHTQIGPQRIFLTRRDLKAMGVGVSNTTLLRWEELGRFPRRVRFSNTTVAWPRELVMDWCEERIAERDNKLPSS
jgi:prophage regulatory protein